MKVSLYERGDWAKVGDAVEPFIPFVKPEILDDAALRGIAVTVKDNGESICCGGIAFLNETDNVVWLKMNTKYITHPIATARVIKEIFELMKRSVENKNISTYVLDNFHKGEKLVEFMGMKKNCESIYFRNHKYNKFTVVV